MKHIAIFVFFCFAINCYNHAQTPRINFTAPMAYPEGGL